MLETGRDTQFSKLVARDSDSMTIQMEKELLSYEIIKVIEFTSDRKMMTIVLKDKLTNKFYAFSKGADVAILPKVKDFDVVV